MDGEIQFGGEPMSDFDLWCFAAQSKIMLDGKPVPLLTELLHRVCDGDSTKFSTAIDILRAAFEAGNAMPRATQ